MKKRFAILILFIFLFGCATAGGQSEWYTAQKDYMLAYQSAPQRPLFEMKALPGTSIQNLESLTVYAPTPSAPKELKQFVETPHPAWDFGKTLIRTAGQVGLGLVIADGLEGIFDSFSKVASIPTSSMTQNISGIGNTGTIRSMGDMSTGSIGDGSFVGGIIDQTSDPTIVDPVIVETEPLIVRPTVVRP